LYIIWLFIEYQEIKKKKKKKKNKELKKLRIKGKVMNFVVFVVE